MSIRAQILGSLGILFLVVLLMFGATWSITSQQKSDGLVINLAGRQRMEVQKIAKDVLAFAHQAAAGSLAADVRKHLAAFTATQTLLARGGTYTNGKAFTIDPPSPEVAALLDEAGRLTKPFEVEAEAILAKAEGSSAQRLVAASETLVAAQDRAVARLQAETEDDVATLMTIQAGGMGLCALVFFGVLFMLGRTLQQPLSRLLAYADAVAGGNLKAVAAGSYPSELLVLREALARMVASLEAKVVEVGEKSREAEGHAAEADRALAAAREQESRTAELLARLNEGAGKARAISDGVMEQSAGLLGQVGQVGRGAQHQRDRMMDTATAMEEMNATVLEVARNASSAATSAAEAKDKAVIGARGVRSAVESIESIRQRILELKESMTRLGQQADSIGHIMNVISDIADQTNLLALNAFDAAFKARDWSGPMSEMTPRMTWPAPRASRLVFGRQTVGAPGRWSGPPRRLRPGALPGCLGALGGAVGVLGHLGHGGVHPQAGGWCPIDLGHAVGHWPGVGQILKPPGRFGQAGPLGLSHGLLSRPAVALGLLGLGLGSSFLGLDFGKGGAQFFRHIGHGRHHAAIMALGRATNAHGLEPAGRDIPGHGRHFPGFGAELATDASRHQPGREDANTQGKGQQDVLQAQIPAQRVHHGGYLFVGRVELSGFERIDARIQGFGAGVEIAHKGIARFPPVFDIGLGHAHTGLVHGLEILGHGRDFRQQRPVLRPLGQGLEFVCAASEAAGRFGGFLEAVVFARGRNIGEPLLHIDGHELHPGGLVSQGQALGAHELGPILYAGRGKGHD